MSLEAILGAIEASGEAELAQLRAETESHARRILAEAERQAALRREAARRAALSPASGERARRLHQAKLEALRLRGEVRERLVETALAEVRRQLANLRASPDYPRILRRLAEEAIAALGEDDTDSHRFVLEVDARDETLMRRILKDLGPDVPVTASLHFWGGVVARSPDGRIVATNTLEARLERATPFLRRDLSAFFEKELKGTSELASVPSVP